MGPSKVRSMFAIPEQSLRLSAQYPYSPGFQQTGVIPPGQLEFVILCILCKGVVICRMGRVDVIAKALIGLEGEFEGQLDFVLRAAESMRTEDVTNAWVQVSSALATMDRPDIMTDVRS